MNVSRRALLTGAVATGALGAIGVPLLSGVRGASSTGVLLRSRRPLPPRFATPLTVPPVLAPFRSDGTTDYYRVTAAPATARILPDVPTPIWGYEGRFPGPTIVSRSGRRTVVTHINRLPVPTVVHLHGGHTPADSDGYPTDLLLPVGTPAGPHVMRHSGDPAGMGAAADPHARIDVGSRDYAYPWQQRAATLWYHDHRMDFTGAGVWRGLAGFHLVTDDHEDALPLPRGDRDLPLMVTDRSFDATGRLLYPGVDPSLLVPGVTGRYSAGVLGDVVLVNGRPWPYHPVVGARYRLRLLNASNARRYRFRLVPAASGTAPLVQIGSDGGLLDRPRRHDAVELAPGERCELVVDFARYAPDTRVRLVDEFGDGQADAVLEFRVGEPVRDDTDVPDQLSDVPRLDPATAEVTRTMHFRDSGRSLGRTINGSRFSPGSVNASVRRGATEIWHLVTDFHHPVHLHLVHFQVLSRGLGGPGPYDHGWKDVIDLRPAERASVIMRFDGSPGRYVFHCHNLEHEDMAMMGNVVVR